MGKSIVIPDGTKFISNHCYSGDPEITDVRIPDSVQEIGVGAFENCAGLETVELGCGVRRLKKDVFSGCTALREINIPDSLESIGEWAFRDCRSLRELKLPAGIEVCEEAFLGCDNLRADQ